MGTIGCWATSASACCGRPINCSITSKPSTPGKPLPRPRRISSSPLEQRLISSLPPLYGRAACTQLPVVQQAAERRDSEHSRSGGCEREERKRGEKGKS